MFEGSCVRMPELSIVIPAHNEARRIAGTLEDYLAYFPPNSRLDMVYEIVVVLNGCTDGTLGVVEEFSRRFPQIRFKVFRKRLGKGGAIVEGVKIASGDTVAYVDADGDAPPAEIDKLRMSLGNDAGVIGSRWLPQSDILVKQPLTRRIASRGFNAIVRFLFGLPFTDTQCGCKVFKREPLVEAIGDVTTMGFAFDVELLYLLKQKGYTVKEIPISWQYREGSKLRLPKEIAAILLQTVRVRLVTLKARGSR